MIPVTGLSPKQIYHRYYANAKKNLGQNFLFDENINRKIVNAANIENKIVVEVGPGPGGLTLEILRRDIQKLYIIEYDSHWCDVWRELQQQSDGRLELIRSDALKYDISLLKPNVVISNLPYNISTKLLTNWFRIFSQLDELVLMFQKEVADRIIAEPRTKAYGQLSILSQWLADVQKVCDLSPAAFTPSPKVYSSVLKFQPRHSIDITQYDTSFLEKAFSQRRKVMRKNVDAEIMQKIYAIGYNGNVRAEEISVEDYVKLLESSTLPRKYL